MQGLESRQQDKMVSLGRIGVMVAGSAGVLMGALLMSKHKQLNLLANSAPGGNEGESATGQKWDSNWDKMAPDAGEKDESGEVVKSKASRTLILIRHGQYVWDPHDHDKRILTELGRKQAAVTGQRLKELGHSYTTLHFSTMPRATETADIIMRSLTDVPTKSCDLMREGAPIRPEPTHKKWRPELYVRQL